MKDDLSTVRCTVSPFLNHASVLISECKDSESYHQTVCCYFIPSGNMAEWKSNMSFAKGSWQNTGNTNTGSVNR